MRLPSSLRMSRCMVLRAGLFFDLAGCQMAGHFSMLSSERILSASLARKDGLLVLLVTGSWLVGWVGSFAGSRVMRVSNFLSTHAPLLRCVSKTVFKKVFR